MRKETLNIIFGMFCLATGIALFINHYLFLINFTASLIFHPEGIVQEFLKSQQEVTNGD